MTTHRNNLSIRVFATLLILILVVASAGWVTVGQKVWQAVEAGCTLITIGATLHAIYGIATPEIGTVYQAEAEHHVDSPSWSSVFSHEINSVYYGEFTSDGEMTTHSPDSQISDWDKMRKVGAVNSAYGARVVFSSFTSVRYVEHEDGGWDLDPEYGVQTWSAPEFTSDQFIEFLVSDAVFDALGVFILWGHSEMYGINKWPMISEITNDGWVGTSLNQKSLDLAESRDIRYDACFHYDVKDLTWEEGSESQPGYWSKGAVIEDMVFWTNIPAWKDREIELVSGNKILKRPARLLHDWYRLLGMRKFKTVETHSNRNVAIKISDILGEDENGDNILGNETNVVRRLPVIDYGITITETESLTRKWRWFGI